MGIRRSKGWCVRPCQDDTVTRRARPRRRGVECKGVGEDRMRDLVPGIYCHWVVDEHGRHPTIADIEKILAHMLKYVTDPDLNFQRRIDTKIGPHPPLADGKRRAANFRRYQSRDIQNQSANIKIFMGPPQRSDRTNRGQEPATLWWTERSWLGDQTMRAAGGARVPSQLELCHEPIRSLLNRLVW